MSNRANHLVLALLFSLFAIFAAAMSPGALSVIDQFAFFFFGVLAGVQFHMFWVGDADSTAGISSRKTRGRRDAIGHDPA